MNSVPTFGSSTIGGVLHLSHPLQNLEKEDQIQSVEAECGDKRVKDDVVSDVSDVTPKWWFGMGNPFQRFFFPGKFASLMEEILHHS